MADFDEMRRALQRATDPTDPVELIEVWCTRLLEGVAVTNTTADLVLDLRLIASRIKELRLVNHELQAEVSRLSTSATY